MPSLYPNSSLAPNNVAAGMLQYRSRRVALSHQQQLREAVLLTFVKSSSYACACLAQATSKQWTELLEWLDTSGLALYFLARLEEIGSTEILPPQVLSRLQQNRVDNTRRNAELIAESIAIHREFQRAELVYATLKGYSLGPLSVPDFDLRSQLDLDFLIAEESVVSARRILAARGYRLSAVSGRSWEFKADESRQSSLLDLYKPGKGRSVELHVEQEGELDSTDRSSVLSRTQQRRLHGMWIPVLRPVDLFLGQALHLHKHMSSEFMRTAHLLEFYRHVFGRFEDHSFWKQLREVTENQPTTRIHLGVVLQLMIHVMRVQLPEDLAVGTADTLPLEARLWIERFGSKAVFASHPGTKLYLLLQQALAPAGITPKRSLMQSLVPRGLPPTIAIATQGETSAERDARRLRQFRYLLFRLKFHTVEGFRFLYQSVLWQRWRRGITQ